MAVKKVEANPDLGAKVIKRVSVKLPTQKTTPPSSIESYTLFIYGLQKIGKTSFTMQFQDVLHFMFEPSAKDYSVYEVVPESWDEFKGYVNLLKEEKKAGTLKFKTFALDTIDLCYQLCARWVCDNNGVDHLSQGAYGALYEQCNTEFRDTMIALSRLGGFIALSHSKDKEIELKNGGKYQMTVPSSANGCSLVMAKFCDVIGHYHIGKDGKRYLQIRPNNEAEAGNRLESKFHYSNGDPIMDIPMGESAVEAYKNFNLAFNSKLDKPKKEITQSPSPIKLKGAK